MYRTILVPLDGSSLAERALPWAQRMAAAADGRLVMLRVVPETAPSAGGDPPQAIESRGEAEAYLHGLTERLGAAPFELHVLAGDAAQTILGQIPGRGVGLIVMSTLGSSGLGRWIYGSVADAVMRHASVPVLLIPAASALRELPADRAPRILVPLDYSPLSEAVLSPAGELAEALGAELILLSVTPLLMTADLHGTGYVAYDVAADRQARQGYLEGIATRLREAGHAVRVREEFGLVGAVIDDVGREEGVDLIAIATQGRGGATRLLMGSVATGVVQRATVPVLVVRPAAAPPDEAHTVGH
jgi:nucleotide-binding universal stress UspA family protein